MLEHLGESDAAKRLLHALEAVCRRGRAPPTSAARRRPRRSATRSPGGSTMAEWWRDAVFYEIYVRSFADSNGDGVGDLAGIRSRLPYLRDLGVEAIWLTPFYPSPGADHGYDVADYVDVDPLFGTLDDFDDLVAAAHEAGIHVVVDIVPNHTSSEHPWFAGDRSRYVTVPASNGLPNNWPSNWGGPAWTLDESRDEYYLHLFAPEQPDLDWHEDAGAPGLRRDPALLARSRRRRLPHRRRARPRQERIARGRAGADPRRALLLRLADRDRPAGSARHLSRLASRLGLLCGRPRVRRRDRLLGSGARRAVSAPGRASARLQLLARVPAVGGRARSRASIDEALAALPIVTWVLENHDVTRIVTRFGAREARAAALLLLALPGPVFLYQGQELGLEEVDLPDEVRQDPIFIRSGGARKGRDGCRVPLPWSARAARARLAAAAARRGRRARSRRSSTTTLRRLPSTGARWRSARAARFAWHESPAGSLVFARDELVVRRQRLGGAVPAPERRDTAHKRARSGAHARARRRRLDPARGGGA